MVLSLEHLKFLIRDKEFDTNPSPALKRIKDVFVFGCTTGLRFSDIYDLTPENFEKKNEEWYQKIKSQKTKTYSFIKLPSYAVEIYKMYKSKSSKQIVFKPVSLFIFNRTLKEIGRLTGFTNPINFTREHLGKVRNLKTRKPILFCDKMSSHMMRRTAITILLILGMPEHLVRKISRHSHASNSFNKYVHYAQAYIDKEIDKIHRKFSEY